MGMETEKQGGREPGLGGLAFALRGELNQGVAKRGESYHPSSGHSLSARPFPLPP
jgi:hypothetical protein